MKIEDVWVDILSIHYNPKSKNQVLRKYKEQYATCRLTVSSYNLLTRFSNINRGQAYNRQIKPYNFITTGVGHRLDPDTGETIVPMLPYIDRDSKQFGTIERRPFIDYKTGTLYNNNVDEGQLWTKMYWKPLHLVVTDYMDHAESKFNKDKNATGRLPRQHIVITDRSIRYIGKETNELETTQTIGVDPENYTEYIHWKKIIEGTTPDLAAMVGISRRNLSYLKRRTKQGEPISLKRRTMEKLLKIYQRRV